jgi:hypothetical protein
MLLHCKAFIEVDRDGYVWAQTTNDNLICVSWAVWNQEVHDYREIIATAQEP